MKTSLKCLLIFLHVFFSLLVSNAQNTSFSFQHIKDENGLPLGFTQDVVFDSLGFAWISGWDKIYRYDGQNVSTFNFRDIISKSNGLQGRIEVRTDHEDWLWIMDNKRIYHFDPYHFRIESTIDLSPYLLQHKVWNSSFQIIDDKIFITSNFNLRDTNSLAALLFEVRDGQVEVRDTIYSESGRGPILHIRNQKPAVIIETGLLQYESDEDCRFLRFPGPSIDWPTSFQTEGGIWIRGVSIHNKGDTITYYLPSHSDSFQLIKLNLPESIKRSWDFLVRPDDIWIHGVNETLFRYDRKLEHWSDYSQFIKNLVDFPFIGAETTTFTVSETGEIWMGTTQGLIKIVDRSFPIKHHLSEEDERCLFDFCSMRGMSEDDEGFIYLSFYEDLYRLDTSNDQCTPIFEKKVSKPNGVYSLLHNDGQLYWDGFKIDLSTKEIKSLIPKEYNGHVASCFDENALWLYSWASKVYYKYYWKSDSIASYVVPDVVYSIGEECNDMKWDKEQNLMWWAMLGNGLIAVDSMGEVKHHFSNSSESAIRLPSNDIRIIYFDEKGLWIGHSLGFSLIDTASLTIRNITLAGGKEIPVVGILKDDHDRMWLSSEQGLFVMENDAEIILSFPLDHTLSRAEFNRNSYFQSSSGQMYFGALNGVFEFNPNNLYNKLKENTPSKSVLLTEFTRYNISDNEVIPTRTGLGDLDTILLTYQDKYFTLSYAFPDFQSGKEPLFTYKLENYDLNWSRPSSYNQLRYNNLPPGNYELKIATVLDKDSRSKTIRRIFIIVQRPWFKTWWFYGLCVLIMWLITLGVFRWRLYQRTVMERMRQKISNDLHDDVGTVLTGLTMQAEILSQTTDPELQSRLGKIVERSRYAMMKMRDIVWAIDSRKDHVEDLIQRVRDYAFEVLDETGKSFSIDSNLRDNRALRVDVRQNLYLICKEVIANFIKHSNGDRFKIVFLQNRKSVLIEYTDNGSPKPIHFKPSGQGLLNIKERVQDLGGKVDITTDNGFRVAIEIRSF